VLRCALSEGEAYVLQAVPPSTGIFLIVSPSTVALSHRKSASSGTPRDSCRAEGYDESRTFFYVVRNEIV
jgi:hypothetical protein